MGDDLPLSLSCNLAALDPDQRRRRAELAERIRATTIRVVEGPDGFALHLPRSDAIVRQAEELIALERRCCSFLTFAVRDDAAAGVTVLEIEGGEAAKAFIAAEIGVLGEPGR